MGTAYFAVPHIRFRLANSQNITFPLGKLHIRCPHGAAPENVINWKCLVSAVRKHIPWTALRTICGASLCFAHVRKSHERSRSPWRRISSPIRKGNLRQRPHTLCVLLIPATTWRSRVAYCSRVSSHGRFGVLSASRRRIQATAVSCNSTSAQQPGCTLASPPQKVVRPVPSRASANSGVMRPVTVLKKGTPAVDKKGTRLGCACLEPHR